MHPVVTKRLEFDYAHRVLGHGNKCRHIHGHRGVAEISVRARMLNDLGMVVDFGIIKTLVGAWIDDNWDHNILLHPDDPLYELLTRPVPETKHYTGGRAPYILNAEHGKRFANPTAENIARVLFEVASVLLFIHNVEVVSVRIHETPSCWADYPCSR